MLNTNVEFDLPFDKFTVCCDHQHALLETKRTLHLARRALRNNKCCLEVPQGRSQVDGFKDQHLSVEDFLGPRQKFLAAIRKIMHWG